MNRLANHAHQRGLAVTEFAIVLPLLLFLVFATAEVGRYLYQYNSLTKAVRDGARYLSMNSYTAAGAVTEDAWEETKNVILYGSTTADDSSEPVLPGLTRDNVEIGYAGEDLRISISGYGYHPMVFSSLPGFGLWNDISLTVFQMPVAMVFVPLE
jgi:hypothetical protein